MSVSFIASQSPIAGWNLTCLCGGGIYPANGTVLSRERAEKDFVSMKESGQALPGCADEDCAYYGFQITAVTMEEESAEVNMANGNVRPVLEALGLAQDGADFEDICFGSLPAEDFLGRVMVAQAAAPVSAERPTITDVEEGKATMVHCGVGEGYVQEKLDELREVAEFAVAHGRTVQWG